MEPAVGDILQSLAVRRIEIETCGARHSDFTRRNGLWVGFSSYCRKSQKAPEMMPRSYVESDNSEQIKQILVAA